MSKRMKTPHAVIAAVRDDTGFKAVALHKRSDTVEIQWARCSGSDGATWESFAAECGLDGRSQAGRSSGGSSAAVAVGLDASAVAFYRIDAPHVGREETDSIVRMQAESLLPLPPSQIEVAWRALPSNNGNMEVTIAAARRDYLRRFAADTRSFRPETILPACEGTARTWYDLFSERERQALVISIGARNTQLSVVVNGSVTNAAMLDIGMTDLAVIEGGALASSEAMEVTERFAQDIRSVLASFQWSESAAWPMLVLSDGSAMIDRVVAALNGAGLEVKESLPKPQTLGMPTGLGTNEVYEYRAPLGLALIILDGAAAEPLDLFGRMNRADEEEKAKSTWRSTVLAGIVAVVMLVVLLATWCVGDVITERRLGALVAQPEFKQARDRQTLLKTVARHRPDMLDLFAEVSGGREQRHRARHAPFQEGPEGYRQRAGRQHGADVEISGESARPQGHQGRGNPQQYSGCQDQED